MAHSRDSMQELLSLQCPQNWLQETSYKYMKRIVNNYNRGPQKEWLDITCDNEPGEMVYRFKRLITLIFNKYLEEKYDDGFEMLDTALLSIDLMGTFGKTFAKSFKYVLDATKAFFYWKDNNLKMMTEVCKLISNEEYTKFDMSGIYYIKYLFLLKFGKAESTEALKAIKNAHKLNPDKHEFIYCTASLMTSIRNFSWPKLPPSPLEVRRLEYLYSQNPDSARYTLKLARVYSEMQFDYKNKNSYYRDEAIKLAESCLQKLGTNMTDGMVAKAIFFLIRSGYTKIEIFEDLVTEVLSRIPTSVQTSHYFGIFFSILEKWEEALMCFSEALNELPYLLGSVLYLRSALCIDEDNSIFIEDTLSQYEEYMEIGEAYLGISEYYLMVKSDLELAVTYFLKADKEHLMQYKLSCCKKKILYCELLKAEIVNNLYKYEESKDVHDALDSLSSVIDMKYSVAYLKKWMY